MTIDLSSAIQRRLELAERLVRHPELGAASDVDSMLELDIERLLTLLRRLDNDANVGGPD